MFWLFAVIVGFVFIVLAVKEEGDDIAGFWGCCAAFFLIVGGIVSLLLIMHGVSIYPDLKGQYEEIMALRRRIEGIRESYYSEKLPEHAIVAGSLTNLQQSSRLAEYISELAQKEAHYSNALARAKIYKEALVYRFFGCGTFIFRRIYELEEIK
jgi:hypothetical protein